MKHTKVVIIGGGATGVGILRDACMRGLEAVLFEQGGLAHGTSSRFHGLLHSGARYAVRDAVSAQECLEENLILRRVAKHCIEETEGYFVLTQHDDPAYVPGWVDACAKAGIDAEQVPLAEALRLEPHLDRGLQAVYRVPDSCVDGFRLVWHNAMAARAYGGEVFTYHLVENIRHANGRVTGVDVLDKVSGERFFVGCDVVVNATGAWSGAVAKLAGLDVRLSPDRGTLIVFNHRFTSRVINRLHPPGDGDIFVPHGSVTISGTTSFPTDSPDNNRPTTEEVLRLLELGKPMFPHVYQYRLLRAFAGSRPLYDPDGGTGRSASRNFHIVNHTGEGLQGMLSIFGGKLTTYRLMAEKITDMLCVHFGLNATCRTALEPMAPEPSKALLKRAKPYFLRHGVELVSDRTGGNFSELVKAMEASDKPGTDLICECEMVSRAEVAMVARDPATRYLHDVRLRTRMGMGTCQGTFCTLRAVSVLSEMNIPFVLSPTQNIRSFLQERWQGVRPVLWGSQIKECELARAIYAATLNLDGITGEALPFVPSTAQLESSGQAVAQEGAQTEASPVVQEPNILELRKNMDAPYADLVVIGAGLSGLMAALVASRAGRQVTLLAQGAGALSISGGSIDLLGYVDGQPVYGSPWEAMLALPKNHPYRLMGNGRVREALDYFMDFCEQEGYGFVEKTGQNVWIPTVLGSAKPTYLCTPSADSAALTEARRCLLVGIEGFKECSLPLIARHLKESPAFQGKDFATLSIPAPFGPTHRAINALDVARYLDTAEGQRWFIKMVGPHMAGADTLIMPPLCGTLPHSEVWNKLQSALKVQIVEMATVPPGVGGLRLRELLMKALAREKVNVVENTVVSRAEIRDGRCDHVVTRMPDGERRYGAKAFVLATGGFLGGGLESETGTAVEGVFKLPIVHPNTVSEWSDVDIFGKHAFASMGVAVNEQLNPVDARGDVVLNNVHVAGRSLAGYDYATEKSGHGVAIATGWYAAALAGGAYVSY